MAATSDSTVQAQKDTSDSSQIANSAKQQNASLSAQDAERAQADPTVWNRATLDETATNVSTDGKNSLFSDNALPASMNMSDMSMATDATAAGTQTADPMHQYMNDLSSILNNSSQLLGNIGDLMSSAGTSPSADMQNLMTDGLKTAQSVLNLDQDVLKQFGQMAGGAMDGGTLGGSSNGGEGAGQGQGIDGNGAGGEHHCGGGHGMSGGGSDGGSASGGGTTSPASSDGGGTTPPASSDGGGTTPPASSDGGGTTPPASSDGGGTTPPASSDGGGTTPPASSDGGGTTPPASSDGGGTTPPASSDGGGTTPPASSDGGGTTPPASSDGGGTTPPASSDGGGTTVPPGDGSGFVIQNGNLTVNGQLLSGIAVTGEYAQQVGAQNLANEISSRFPGINVVRLATSPEGGAFTNGQPLSGGQSVQDIDNTIQAFNAKGIGVIVDNHDFDANNPNNVAQDGGEDAWFAQIAKDNLNNNMVMYQPENEPMGDPGAVVAEQQSAYNAIRATGSNNVVAFDLIGGSGTDAVNSDPSAYNQDTNYAIDMHLYAANDSDPAAKLQNQIAALPQLTEANGGAVPVYVGETGNAIDGTDIDPAGTQDLTDAWSSGHGAIAWLYDGAATGFSGGNADMMTDPNDNLTDYGKQIASLIAQGAT